MQLLGEIKYCTIHCAATPEGRDVKSLTINQWDIAKFGQISYHYVIELDGKIVQTLPLTQKGAHTGGVNTGNIGVCYVGGVDSKLNAKDTRTGAQKDSLKKLILELKAKYPKLIIKGHNEWAGVKKACPSFSVKKWLQEIGVK